MVMRTRALEGLMIVAAAAALAGCANVVGVEDRSGTWCSSVTGPHDFCDDFDDPGALGHRWDSVVAIGGGQPALGPSNDTGPNLFEASTPASDQPVVAGLSTAFARSAQSICVDFDMRLDATGFLVPPPDAGTVTLGGKLGTITVAFAVLGGTNIGVNLAFASPTQAEIDYVSVDSTGSASTNIAPTPLHGFIPQQGQWMRVSMQMKSASGGGGTLSVTNRTAPLPNVVALPQELEFGDSLSVLVGAEMEPPGAGYAVAFDDVTVDFDCP
jgi:hypothetical protein